MTVLVKILMSYIKIILISANEVQVVIIGAGASGIAAASWLMEHGVDSIVILEAEDRIGGRINTVPFGMLIFIMIQNMPQLHTYHHYELQFYHRDRHGEANRCIFVNSLQICLKMYFKQDKWYSGLMNVQMMVLLNLGASGCMEKRVMLSSVWPVNMTSSHTVWLVMIMREWFSLIHLATQ
jgi:hypothetical protein